MPVKIFVNERRLELSPGVTVSDAVAAFDAALADALRVGTAYVTDGVGRRFDPSTVVQEGMILRVVKTARRAKG